MYVGVAFTFLLLDHRGFESTLHRTVEQFSLCDYVSWCNEIKYIIHSDWFVMRYELMKITLNHKEKDTIKTVYDIWLVGGVRLQGTVQYVYRL